MLTFSSSRSNRKKKVALFACRAVWESCSGRPSAVTSWAGRMGVALNCLMSYGCMSIANTIKPEVSCPYLLERLVVYEARSILRDVELALLYMLAKLPTMPHPSASLPDPGQCTVSKTKSLTYMMGDQGQGNPQQVSLPECMDWRTGLCATGCLHVADGNRQRSACC